MRTIFKTLPIALLLCAVQQSFAQVIRKNYREMTTMEKELLVDALIDLGPRTTSGTVVNNYATNHNQLSASPNTTIHNVNDFLPWHRWFILFFEKELQNTSVTGADKIALPYWDWTSEYYTASPRDNQKSSPLWDANFLGQFNTLWGLGRSVSTSIEIGDDVALRDVLIETNFNTFRSQLEITPFHNTVHGWVNGVMNQFSSPGDPSFYLHHNMVDKVWQDWHNFGRNSSFSDEILPNKSNPSIPDFPSGVPGVSPSSIIDSRASSVKVWFAENGKVILDKYTVIGTEAYRYTGIIEAGSRLITSKNLNGTNVSYSTGDFIIPSGTTCTFTSGGLQMGSAPQAGYIRLVPGFRAELGAAFTARINSLYFTDASAGGRIAAVDGGEQKGGYSERKIAIFPNPSKGIFNIQLNKFPNALRSIKVTNSFGRLVQETSSSALSHELDLSNIEPGIYFLMITEESGEVFTRRLILN